ncbi:type II toxin-antitoxin system RelE/ParE family toxin [Rhizobium jaguaris]|uniref:Type II toxin-antitoxin system RelE/ParE family toxin n=1 Tax=Rhizobium jaguaris TaxID=1312183 RepID=A0A387FP88_9HYPH|nr:type II toxin-antitoxin system RelE/ParE family toxin [Rhizobium jaguaris]AYG60223.1 type II toxin-antitoxin system RelE/ParE family toxin [Rhizobium jaguaris]
MAHRIVFRPAARADLKALYDYIAKQADHRLAGDYIDRIEASCRALTVFPERGTVRDDLLPGIRIIGFERRASIAFIVEADTVRILRVLYGGQSFPEDWSAD